MTSLSPARRAATAKLSPVRIGLFSLFLFALVAFELYLSETSLATFQEQLMNDYSHTDSKGWQKIVAWLVEQLRYWLPFLTVCIFQFAAYRNFNSENGVCQTEMAWQVGIVTVLTYGGLLPYVSHVSKVAYEAAVAVGEEIPKTEGGVETTILMKAGEWFIRTTIPLLLLLVYHATCGRREAKEAAEEAIAVEEASAEVAV